MKLVVGLGNPGEKYCKTRHNAGWWVMAEVTNHASDFLHMAGGIYKKNWSDKGDVMYLLTDAYYMNDHGVLVGEYCMYFKIQPKDVIVIHDELDFEPGVVRMKHGGGAGGHNGVKSIVDSIGANFSRVRVGIGRPSDNILDYVLSEPSGDEMAALKEGVQKAAEATKLLIEQGVDFAMNKVNV